MTDGLFLELVNLALILVYATILYGAIINKNKIYIFILCLFIAAEYCNYSRYNIKKAIDSVEKQHEVSGKEGGNADAE